MRRTLRRAAVNKWLVITLVVCAVASGTYWIFFRPGPPPVVALDTSGQDDTIQQVACSKCGKMKLKQSELSALPFDADKGKFQCPKCKQFTAGLSRSDALRPGGGG